MTNTKNTQAVNKENLIDYVQRSFICTKREAQENMYFNVSDVLRYVKTDRKNNKQMTNTNNTQELIKKELEQLNSMLILSTPQILKRIYKTEQKSIEAIRQEQEENLNKFIGFLQALKTLKLITSTQRIKYVREANKTLCNTHMVLLNNIFMFWRTQ